MNDDGYAWKQERFLAWFQTKSLASLAPVLTGRVKKDGTYGKELYSIRGTHLAAN
jgi:hypothetical protein